MKRGWKVFFTITGLVASFFMFVVPALVAEHVLDYSRWYVIFGLFMYFQLWSLTTFWALTGFCAIYGIRLTAPFNLATIFGDRFSKSDTIMYALLSYGLTIYAYGI